VLNKAYTNINVNVRGVTMEIADVFGTLRKQIKAKDEYQDVKMYSIIIDDIRNG
jgi:hypothetical protein